MNANTSSKTMKSHGQEVTIRDMINELESDYIPHVCDEGTEYCAALINLYQRWDFMPDDLFELVKKEIQEQYKIFKIYYRWQETTRTVTDRELIYVG